MTAINGADSLHRRALVIDGLVFSSDGKIEILQKGNVSAVNVTVSGLNADVEEAADNVADWLVRVAEPGSPWTIVRNTADITAAHQTGKIGLIMGWQNMRAIADRLSRLRLFYALGLRVMQLTYNERNFLGDGCLEPTDSGLSLLGRQAVSAMNEIGIAIDLSHVGLTSAQEAARLSRKPVLLTHANARAVSNVPRNKTDDVIKAVADTGGLVGVSVYGPMCWNGDSSRRPNLSDFYRHLEHIVRLVGPKQVALGTDFPAVSDLDAVTSIVQMTLSRYPAAISKYAAAFGNDIRTRYLSDCSSHEDLPNVTNLLLKRGWSEADITAFLGENYVRVLEQIWEN